MGVCGETDRAVGLMSGDLPPSSVPSPAVAPSSKPLLSKHLDGPKPCHVQSIYISHACPVAILEVRLEVESPYNSVDVTQVEENMAAEIFRLWGQPAKPLITSLCKSLRGWMKDWIVKAHKHTIIQAIGRVVYMKARFIHADSKFSLFSTNGKKKWPFSTVEL